MNKNIRALLISGAYFSTLLLSNGALGGQTNIVNELKINGNISPFEACKAVPVLKKSDYAKDQAYWDQAKKCGVNIQVLPDNGFSIFVDTMISKIGEEDENARTADFLKAVGERAAAYVDQNNAVTEKLIHCERNDQAWFQKKMAAAKSANDKALYNFSSCAQLEKNVLGVVNQVRPVLRQDLALSRYENMMFGDQSNPLKAINYSMQGIVGVISPKMDPLNGVEVRDAVAQFNKDTEAYGKEWDQNILQDQKDLKKGNGFQKFVTKSLIDSDSPGLSDLKPGDRSSMQYQKFVQEGARINGQFKYRAKYMEELAKAPILAFLGASNPTPEQIAKAAELLLKNGLAEREKIAVTLGSAASPHLSVVRGGDAVYTPKTNDEKAKALMKFMKYGPVVNEILRSNPTSCGTATNIVQYIKHTELRNNVELMAGMIGASAFIAMASPAILAGAGIEGMSLAGLATNAALPAAFGIGSTYNSYQNLADANTRTFNAVETVKTGKATGELKDVQAAKGEVALALVTFPLNFVGVGGVKLLANKGAALADKFIINQATQDALRTSLTAKGMAEPEVASIVSALRSGKPNLAAAAVDKVVKTLELDPNELAMMQSVREGMGSKSDRWVKMAMALLPKDEKERQATVKNAVEILSKLNPAKLNDITRPQALKTAIAASRFGVKDPAVIASNINEWDKGIEGLTSVYDLATKKMGTKEFMKIKDVAERQKKAFYSAIDDLSKNDPEFAGMNAEQRLAREAEMCKCGACAI